MSELDNARELICEIGRRLWTRQMVASNDGNISIRVGDLIVCTPAGVSKGFMEPQSLCVVEPDGTLRSGTRPSSEIKMHLRVYEQDPQVRGVVHAHPLYATMWAVRGLSPSTAMLPETIVTIPEIPLAPYATPSTPAVPDSITPFIRSHRACLLEHHGALTWDADPLSAYLTMERLEYTSELAWRLEQAGAVRELPEAEIARLHEVFGV